MMQICQTLLPSHIHSKSRATLEEILLNRVSTQALLLFGMQGICKSEIAIEFAAKMHSRSRAFDECNNDYKNVCDIYSEIINCKNQDTKIISSKMRNKVDKDISGIISIDSIRELRDFLHLTPVISDYKIAILLNIESLSIAASNALLKALEEPSHRTIIILTTNAISKLLPTLLSRCIKIQVSHLKKEDFINVMCLDSSINYDKAGILYEMSGGDIEISKHIYKATKDSEIEQVLFDERNNVFDIYKCISLRKKFQSFALDSQINWVVAKIIISNILNKLIKVKAYNAECITKVNLIYSMIGNISLKSLDKSVVLEYMDHMMFSLYNAL